MEVHRAPLAGGRSKFPLSEEFGPRSLLDAPTSIPMDNDCSDGSILDPFRAEHTPDLSSAPKAVVLYIDADNQSSQNARALISILSGGFGTRIVRATVAGNSNGSVTAGWVNILREEIPNLPISEIAVPCRKDAADAALIMALGADLAEIRRLGSRVVVVSRDALLHAAAERAQASGCSVFLAYADGEIPTARHPSLATLLLPALSTRVASSPSGKPAAPVTIVPESVPAALDIDKLAALVREKCKLQPGGGYKSSDVGQALSQLGYKDATERRRLVASFPGLKAKGAHPNKLLLF